MNRLILTLFISFISIHVYTQQKSKKVKENIENKIEFSIDSSSVSSLDNILKTFYSVISGDKEKARNWKQFKYLFHPDAKLIPAGKDKFGISKAEYLSLENYIKKAGKWLVENGFVEKEISRRVNTFGNIAQVFSSYESYISENPNEPFMRGINSIQLFNDGKRWWIINVFWMHENDDNPIPKAYLPD